MKKRFTVLIILIAVLALSLIVYFVTSQTANRNTTPPMTIDTSPIMIAEDDPSTIVGLAYEYNGQTLEFEFSDIAYKWYYVTERNFPLEQTYLQTMASVISSMAVNRVVEETRDNFAQYGLNEPYLTISATFKPEKEDAYRREYHVGNFNEFNDTYYFNVEGTDIVYTIAGAFTPYFEYELLDLAIGDVMPLFNTAGFEIDSCEVDGEVITDAEMLKGIANAFAKLILDRPIAFESIETFTNIVIEYTESVSVTNEDGSITTSVPVPRTFTCQFGKINENGKTYFTVNDSGLVYLINTDTANAIINSFSAG